jgi:predicted Fe-S protein YdhL (DUF1289 family)
VAKLPSPCIGVCKFSLKGHCVGCSMTRPQKRGFKRAEGKKGRRAFLSMLATQQAILGGFDGWARAYRRRCAKKGLKSPV